MITKLHFFKYKEIFLLIRKDKNLNRCVMDVEKVSKNIKFKQLSPDEMEACLLRSLQEVYDRINQVYVSGTLDFIAREERCLYQENQSTENAINQIWEDCLKGEKPFTLFLNLIEQYYSQIITGVQRYKQQLKE